MHAVTATFGGFPAARSRSQNRRSHGVCRIAASAAKYSTGRTGARPPQMLRRRSVRPLSQLSGATPTRAAIAVRSSCPSSGRKATSVAALRSTTPAMVWRSRVVAARVGQAWGLPLRVVVRRGDPEDAS